MSVNIQQADMITFGERVRRRRNALNLTQEQLSQRIGMHRTDLSDIENDKHSPMLKTMVRLARALDISVPSLLADY